MLPNQVGLPICVEVGRADHAPSWNARGRHIVPALENVALRAAEVPDGYLAGRVVLPQQVGLAVTVEVGGSDHIPSWHPSRRQIIPALEECARQVPHGDLVGGVVLPQQIGVPITVEIAGSNRRPAGESGRRQVVPALEEIPLRATHVPRRHLPRRVVLPGQSWRRQG